MKRLIALALVLGGLLAPSLIAVAPARAAIDYSGVTTCKASVKAQIRAIDPTVGLDLLDDTAHNACVSGAATSGSFASTEATSLIGGQWCSPPTWRLFWGLNEQSTYTIPFFNISAWHQSMGAVWNWYDNCPASAGVAWSSPGDGTYVRCSNDGGYGYTVTVDFCGFAGTNPAWSGPGVSEVLEARCDFHVSFLFDGFPVSAPHHEVIYANGNGTTTWQTS